MPIVPPPAVAITPASSGQNHVSAHGNFCPLPITVSGTVVDGVINLTLIDGGAPFDTDPLRPPLLVMTHATTGTTIPGVGGGIWFYVPDQGGNLVRIGKQVAEITTALTGIVDSTMAYSVQKGGIEVEVFRIRGAAGMLPTYTTGSTATGGGASGLVGGQLWIRGDFLSTGHSSMAGLVLAQRTTQVSTTLTVSGDYYLWANPTASGITVFLPTAVGNGGQTFVVKLVTSAFTCTVAPLVNGQTIDNNSSILLNTQGQSFTFVSDNANYNIT